MGDEEERTERLQNLARVIAIQFVIVFVFQRNLVVIGAFLLGMCVLFVVYIRALVWRERREQRKTPKEG